MKCIDLIAYVAFDVLDGTVSRITIELPDEDYQRILQLVVFTGNHCTKEILMERLPDVYAQILGQADAQFTKVLHESNGFFDENEENMKASEKYEVGVYWPVALDAASMHDYYNTYQFY
ncbi:MAG: hypothetical protein Q4E55_04785 [Bacteroidales bacterium]|nr:hypothetical protein [Bacteroidales bacterium]